jgi:hypothetical protein
MANGTTKVSVNVDAPGLENVNALAKQLKVTLEGAAKAAAKVIVPRAMNQAAHKGAMAQGLEAGRDSSTARSLGAGTGASARDFAKQAQGLGGLVHVYATFAANIFALSAAFNALSKAADTTNMVKGLDQLGAQSGKSLGSLAKQMVAVSDGALSMKDAITNTALATAGGMTSDAILRMTKVAKNASLALGRDLPDSMNRLTRGIVKVEPELLDELGIMTRVIPAQQEYARMIGKTASTLTEFEKKQAFANAALAEGERKFGAIDLQTNNYSKILASMTNITTAGLELVNYVLTPVVTLLATSPAALSIAMATLSAVLLKQAIPAIGSYRASLKKMEEDSLRSLVLKKDEMEERTRISNVAAAREGEAQFLIAKDTQKRISALQNSNIATGISIPGGREVRSLTKKSAFELTEQDQAALKAREKAWLDSDINTHRLQGIELQKYNNSVASILQDRKNAGDSATEAEIEKSSKFYNFRNIQEANYSRTVQQAARSRILSIVAETTALEGPAKAYRLLNQEIARSRSGKQSLNVDVIDPDTGKKVGQIAEAVKPINRLQAGVLRVSGAFSILAGVVGAVGTRLMAFLPYVGLIIAGFGALNELLSSNSEQSAKFSASLDESTDSVANMGRTLDAIAKKDPLEKLNVESIQAKSTALIGLADSASNLVTDFKKLRSASSTFDKILDAMWGGIGKGSDDKLAQNLTKSVGAALDALPEGVNKAKAIEAISKAARGMDPTKPKEFQQAISRLDDPTIVSTGEAISRAIASISRESGEATNSLVEYKSSLDNISKSVGSISASIAFKDPLGLLGSELIANSSKLDKAIKDPINGITALKQLVDSPQMLSLLPEDTATNLISARGNIDDITKSLVKAREEATAASTALAAIDPKDDKAKQAQQTVVSQANVTLKEIETRAAKAVTSYTAGISSAIFEKGVKILEAAVAGAMEEGAISAAKGYLSALSAAGGATAEQEGKLQQQQFAIQRKIVEASYAAARAQERNTLAIEKNTISQEMVANAAVISSSAPGSEKFLEAMKKAEQLTSRSIVLQTKQAVVDSPNLGTIKELMKGTQEQKQAAQELNGFVTSMYARTAELAKIDGLAKEAAFNSMRKQFVEQANQENKSRDNSIRDQENLQIKLNTQQQILGVYNEQLASQKLSSDIELVKLKAAKEVRVAQADVDTLNNLGGKSSKDSRVVKALKEAEDLQRDLRTKSAEDIRSLESKYQLDALAELESRSQKERESYEKSREYIDLISKAKLDSIESELKYKENMRYIDEVLAAEQRASIELARQKLDHEKDVLATKNAQANLDSLTSRVAIGEAAGLDTTALSDELARQTGLILDQKDANDAVNASRINSIELTKQQTIEQANLNEMLKGLASAFGDVGTAMGNTLVAFEQLINSQQSAIEQQKNYNDIISKLPEGDERATAQKKLADLVAKTNKQELQGYGKVAGEAKKMFAEKTGGYKVLDKVEKASHLASMARTALEYGTKISTWFAGLAAKSTVVAGETALEQAGFMARIPIYIAEIYARTIGQLGVFGPPVAAGLVALALGSMGGGGKGGVVDMTGLTSKDRQETQGTGLSWRTNADGSRSKQENGGGIFGDAEAKSTAIVDSLAIMKENSIVGLDYDNKMLKALETLASSVEGAAKSLYSIPGLRQGTNFGSQEGTSTISGGFGSSVPIIGGILSGLFGGKTTQSNSITSAGIQLKGTFDDLIKGTSGSILQYKDVLSQFNKSGGLFGSSKSWSTLERQTQALSANVTTAISDIFRDANSLFVEIGTKTNVSADQISMALKSVDVSMPIDIMNLTGQALVDELNGVIGAKLSDAAKVIFSGFDKFRTFGEDYLTTVLRVVDANNKVDQSLRSIGNSFNIISNFDVSESLINAAEGLTAFMDQASFFKDNFLSAAEKLAPVQASVSKQLLSLGISSSITREEFKRLVLAQNLNTYSGAKMYQSLMELAPGFDEATKGVDSLNSSVLDLQAALLTAQGRTYEALQATRSSALASMSLEEAAIRRQINALEDEAKTRDISITLLTLQGKVTEATQITRSKELLALKDTDKLIQLRIYALQDEAKASSLESAIYTALGNSAEALRITREQEIKTLEEYLIPSKKYLYALQDEATVKGKLTTAYNAQSNALNSTISSLGNSIKSINDYKVSLTGGQSSILTPAEKYAQAKSQVDQLAAISAMQISTTGTAAEITVQTAQRDEALGKLTAATSTFLEASKDMNSMGSAQYQADFSSVLSVLNTTGDLLTSRKTDAERQLETLDRSLSFLDVIAGNSDTIASLMVEYLAIHSNKSVAQQSAIHSGSAAAASATVLPGFAMGGLASGVAVVGEAAPEIIDFKTPGRVYSNRDSKSLFNTQELVDAVNSLRAEVTQLRNEQREQTRHLIASNYDANSKNADAINQTAEANSIQQSWKERSQVKLS